MAAEPTETAESMPQTTTDLLDALLCRRGTLWTPTKSGGFSCSCGCSTPDKQEALGQLTLVHEQETLDCSRVATDDTLNSDEEDDDLLSYTRTAHCPDCVAEQNVSAKVMQTRSADEPSTRHYTCKVCGESWREDG